MTEEQKVQEESVKEQAEAPEAAEQQVEDAAEQETTAEESGDALIQAQEEVAGLKDQMLRMQAEMQNIRRRADLDVEKAHKFGLEKFANEMLAVVDNLERGLAAAPEEEATKAIRDGMTMTLEGMISSLAKFKVEVVNPVNDTFNPEFHQAMTMIESPAAPANTVIDVMQKGYTLNGRLLRPAMVVVSKGAPAAE
ncbi:MAG: nucleotide exchange factor GrpE [Oceanospirillaceae bacterium]|nr:nucleotide exchange factor GrpE [Oceanospirillaceae bacterium]